MYVAPPPPPRDCKALYDDEGMGTSKTYTVDCDGDGQKNCEVFCEMQKGGGGWTMLINLQTSDGAIQHYDQTGFWTSAAPVGQARWDIDYKGEAIFHMKPTEVMMHVRV